MKHHRSLLLLVVVAAAVNATPAAERHETVRYFRSDLGINANAVRLPENFDAPPRWRVPLDSGHSTPLVCAGRIFLTTYNAAAQELATVALNGRDGTEIWKAVSRAPKIEAFHPQTGNAASCSPACDGERLYVFFGSYGLVCYNLEGNQLWEHRMGPFQDEYGAGSSPVLIDDKVILNEDHDINNFIIAINRFTGKTIWRTARPDTVRSYSTPVIWSRDGGKELLVAGPLELASYDPATGARLWWKHGLARIVIPAPVPSGDMIYMASWAPGGDASGRIALGSWQNALAKWDQNKDAKLGRAEIEDANVLDRFYRMDRDQNGVLDGNEWDRHAEVFKRAENAVLAIKPSSMRGELSDGDVVWKYNRGIPYVATPLLDKNILWMVKDGGLVTKLNALTGKLLQDERLPAGGSYYASPVTGDGKVYFASEQGAVTVVANQPDWNVISFHAFREKIYATPVIERDHLLIRTEKALYYFGRN